MELGRVKELEVLIRRHQDRYYKGQATISDAEFDNLWDELKSLDPDNELFKKVGDDSLDGFPKVQHVIPMGSQQKANSQEEVAKWLMQFNPTEQIIVQSKLDGCSIELYYKNGVFKSGVTRGDGITGDDITDNVSKMQGCVKRLVENFTGSVRGEVLMFHEEKNKYFPQMANCRNAASGVMKRKTGEGCELLHIVTYDAMYEDEDKSFERESQKISWLAAQGFETVDTTGFGVKSSLENSAKELTEIMLRTNEHRAELPYDLDGIVLKKNLCDKIDLRNLLPETQIAYKFPREELVSTLVGIQWSLTNGTFTPIGLLDPPLQLCGTTVKQASLCNIGLIEKGGFKIGCKVSVTKRGEIIPKIEKVYQHMSGETEVFVPEKCPECGNKLYTNADRTKTQCLNPFCPSIKVGKMNKWVNIFAIKELAPTTLGKLLDAGIVDGTIASLYKIDYSAIEKLEGFGAKSAEAIKRNLSAVKEVDLADFIAGFNIPSIGPAIAKKIISGTKKTSIKDLATLTVEDCICPGVGEEFAKKFVEGLRANLEDMRGTLSYISIKNASEGILEGVSVCFTGSLKTMKRNEAATLVKDAGGTVKDDVVKGLTYLVTNDPNSGSAKNKKAQEQGTKVITEEEFLALVKGSPKPEVAKEEKPVKLESEDLF